MVKFRLVVKSEWPKVMLYMTNYECWVWDLKIITRLPWVMKEFGEDKGVIYVDISENVLRKAFELIEEGSGKMEEEAMKFFGKNSGADIVEVFERILEELK